MKKLTALLSFLILFTAFTCEDEPLDSDLEIIGSANSSDLVGEWELVSLDVDGSTITDALGITIEMEFTGEAANPNYTVVFGESTFTANGSYDYILTTTSFGETTSETFQIDNASSSGTYSVNGNELTIDGELMSYSVNGVDESMITDQQVTNFGISNNGNTLTMTQTTDVVDSSTGFQVSVDLSAISVWNRIGNGNVNSDPCEDATTAANQAEAAYNADSENADLCSAYIVALENKIDACGDTDGSTQAIIDGLGNCDSNQNSACQDAIEETNQAETAYNADTINEDLCNAYVQALENQIMICGDEDGNLQAIIDDLDDCIVNTYAIGDIGPAGGYVFYVTNGGANGLEIAPEETQFQSQWGCPISNVAGTVSDFGSGQANSNLILEHHENIDYYNNPDQCTNVVLATGDVAAKNCDDLIYNGFDDWYLPSFDELQMVYDNLHSQGMGDINPSHWFSSSTQDPNDFNEFRVLVFTDGTNFGLNKNDLTHHRAIRQF